MATAVILAGGLCTRLRSIIPNLPKPMAPIGDRPFLEYQLDYWIAQGVNRFVLSVGYRHQVIIDYFGNSYKGVEVDYVIEQKPLGTGGALLLAAEKVTEETSFLLLNGDTYFAADLKVLAEFAKARDADWCVSMFRPDEGGRYMGMEISQQGQIISLKSDTGGRGSLANGGVYWVHSRALVDHGFSSSDRVSLEDEIFPTAMASGQRMFGIEFTGIFIDIGVPEDYLRAPALLEGSG